MTEAAKPWVVTNHRIRRLIKTGVLPAEQVVRAHHTKSAPMT
jgi:hypothetical protein